MIWRSLAGPIRLLHSRGVVDLGVLAVTSPRLVTSAAESHPPEIAMVIPAHDAARTINATLASLAGQSLPATEVVVVDDGSTDDGMSVVRLWEAQLPIRIVTMSGPCGVAAARNAGVAASTSPLVTLLDADDILFPDHIESLAALHTGPLDVVSADALRWIPGLATSLEPWSSRCPLPAPDHQRAELLKACWLVVASLFDRTLFDEVGGFRPGLRRAEDWDLWLRMAAVGAHFVRPDHATMLYRLRVGSATTGDHLMTDVITVLEDAQREATTADQRRNVAIGLRRVKAEHALYRAYEAAESGRHWRARRAALASLRGNRRVAIRGAAMTLAPRAIARRRAATHYEPAAWMRR
jgi:glycosyltransferase involved in cell wall biosynthesis